MKIKNLNPAVLRVVCLCLFLGAVVPVHGEAKYYGYFAIDYVSANGVNNIAAVKNFTNLNHMGFDPALLLKCRETNTKALLDLRWHFFPSSSALRTDYVAYWNSLAPQIAPYIAEVGAFYIFDEPYGNGATKADIETVSALIKSTFKSTPTMIIEAGPQITSSYNPPANVDWIGFDWYGIFTPDIPNYLNILKSRVSSTQRIFLVPQGYIQGSETDAQVAAWNQSYYDLALAEPKVIGLLAFRYDTAVAMAQTYAKQQQIGALIGAWPNNPWPPSYCGDAAHKPIAEDLSDDCYVNFKDVLKLIEHWCEATFIEL